MPLRPREITDQITDARLREVIRYIVNQEVNRLSRELYAVIDALEARVAVLESP